jgi:hypothetical protein
MNMMGKKILSSALGLLLCTSLFCSQSLVDVAKKEKERRAKLKEKSSQVVTNENLKKDKQQPKVIKNEDLNKDTKKPKVVTNEDLKKMKKQPSVSVPQDQEPGEDTSDSEDKPDTKPDPQEPMSSEKAKGSRSLDLDMLEQKYENAREAVELLTAKMNGLFMKYYGVADTTPKEMIQSEISRTYLQLQKAQDDVDKAKKELEEYTSKK